MGQRPATVASTEGEGPRRSGRTHVGRRRGGSMLDMDWHRLAGAAAKGDYVTLVMPSPD
jgi:hypothetical protein